MSFLIWCVLGMKVDDVSQCKNFQRIGLFGGLLIFFFFEC